MAIVIIGASFAGISCSLTLSRLKVDDEIILIDELDKVGYIPNGLNKYLLGEIENLNQSFWIKEEDIVNKGIKLYLSTKVVEIDNNLKIVKIISENGDKKIIEYSKLVCAMGATPISNYIKGSDNKKIISCKNYKSSLDAIELIKNSKTIAVVGTGPIGLEVSWSLLKKNKKIILIEASEYLNFKYSDVDMQEELLENLKDNLDLKLGQRLKLIEDKEEGLCIKTDKETIEVDSLLLAVNFRPNSFLLEGIVELKFDKSVKVTENMETSQKDIYAVGDLISFTFMRKHSYSYVPLINNAIRSGEQAAYHICRYPSKKFLTVRPIISKYFNLYCGSVGLNQEEASVYNEISSIIHQVDSKEMCKIKLIADKKTGKILGGQIVSKENPEVIFQSLVDIVGNSLRDVDVLSKDFYSMKGTYHLYEVCRRLWERRVGL